MKPRKVKSKEGNQQLPERIVFFDGICNFCNSSINFLMDKDERKLLKYAPLQGHTAEKVIFQTVAKESVPDSIVFYEKGVLYFESDAALKINNYLPWYWVPFGLGWFLPRFLRDALYRYVSRNRYRWFGKRDQCRIPSKEESALFLP